ncbi:Uu.00g096130.m01.CDS01 [Anthostomella pinea]|uniref:Uu.00g096130.m01.CDS01 n=1 Tax=Anthostomella pinea TaxID=933095 RepID=A0AAI8VC65_9PEZI|nr:Uu.00g096130.m01.CDS01 [Anthostomella pinea]
MSRCQASSSRSSAPFEPINDVALGSLIIIQTGDEDDQIESFLKPAIGKALLFLFTDHVQDAFKAAMKELGTKYDILTWCEQQDDSSSVDGAVDRFFMREMIENDLYIGYGGTADSEHLAETLLTVEYEQRGYTSVPGYVCLNKKASPLFSFTTALNLSLTSQQIVGQLAEFAQVHRLSQDIKAMYQLQVPIVTAIIHGWAKLMAADSLIYAPINASLRVHGHPHMEPQLKSSMIRAAYEFGNDMIRRIFGGNIEFHRLGRYNQDCNPAGFVVIYAQKSPNETETAPGPSRNPETSIKRLPDALMKMVMVNGKWVNRQLEIEREYPLRDIREELYKLQTKPAEENGVDNEENGIDNEENGINNQENGINNKENRIDNEEKRIDNEENGIDNEENGIDNEENGINNQENGINNKENRIDNEEKRIDNEENGIDNEENGIDNEENGIDNEENGINNKENRIDNEEKRIDNEENGIDNEENGIDNEEKRIDNEENGINNQENGINNKENRTDNEEKRIDNEENGMDNEGNGK